MKKTKKILAFIAASSVMVTGFSGCGGKKTVDNGENVTLNWVLAGDKQEDSELVWAEFNKRLASKLPNTQVNFETIPYGDYSEKWRLMSAANEPIDMAWEGWVLDIRDEVKKGAYMELDELIDEYAPNLKKSMPQWIWDEQRIDGKLYSFPNYQKMVGGMNGLRFLKDRSDKYLDVEGLRNSFIKTNDEREKNPKAFYDAWSDETWNYLESYLEKLKSNGELGLGFDATILNWIPFTGTVNGHGEVAYVEKDKNGKYIAKDIYQNEAQVKKFFKRMHDFYSKGYIRNDVMTASGNTTDMGTEQGYAVWIAAADKFTAQLETQRYGLPIDVVMVNTKPAANNRPSDTNSVIPANSKYPERAMQLYEIINSTEDTDLFNLLVYGIEGQHYKKIGDNKVEIINKTLYSRDAWAVGNSFNAFDTESTIEGYEDYVLNELHDYNNLRLVNDKKLADFVFDETPVRGNVAQIRSVLGEFKDLHLGVVPDWEKRYNEMVEKLNRSGKDKVIKEVQRQLDESLNK